MVELHGHLEPFDPGRHEGPPDRVVAHPERCSPTGSVLRGDGFLLTFRSLSQPVGTRETNTLWAMLVSNQRPLPCESERGRPGSLALSCWCWSGRVQRPARASSCRPVPPSSLPNHYPRRAGRGLLFTVSSVRCAESSAPEPDVLRPERGTSPGPERRVATHGTETPPASVRTLAEACPRRRHRLETTGRPHPRRRTRSSRRWPGFWTPRGPSQGESDIGLFLEGVLAIRGTPVTEGRVLRAAVPCRSRRLSGWPSAPSSPS